MGRNLLGRAVMSAREGLRAKSESVEEDETAEGVQSVSSDRGQSL